MNGWTVVRALVLSCTVAFAAPATASGPTLGFRLSGKTNKTLSLAELHARVETARIRFFHPFYNKDKSYQAFPLAALLEFAYGPKWRSPEYSDAIFIALDGYEAVGSLEKAREAGGYLAFRDLDQESGWEPVGYRKADPGPFFLVWTKPDQTTGHAYPWPWQVTAVNLVRFEDQYPAVVPKGAAKDSPAWRGFTIFRERCLRCHAMNREGGKVGPDLNAPLSITAYRSEPMIKAFIRKPSEYRYTHMPDHTDLADRDLDDLYRYFRFQAGK